MNKLKNKIILILAALLLIIGGVGYYFYSNYRDIKYQAQIHQNNIEALNDSLKTVRNKANELAFQKQALQLDNIMRVSELESLNSELASELEKEKNSKNIVYINKTDNEIDKDTFDVDSTTHSQLDSTTHKFDFKHQDSTSDYSLLFNGETIFHTRLLDSGQISFYNINSTVNKLNFQFDLIHTIKEEKGKYKVSIRSSHPGFKVRNMNSAIVIDKHQPDKWIFGPSVGYGYDITNNNTGVMVGVTLTRKIIGF